MYRCMGCMKEVEDDLISCPFCGYQKGTPAKEAYHLLPGTDLSGRYIIGKVLGYGGFGVTYIGWDDKLLRVVAIKEFLPSMLATRMPQTKEVSVYGGEASRQFEEGLIRFVEEAQRLGTFQNIPGIVDIYDTFVDNSTGYIIMEYLEGEDIKQILKREGPLSFETALPIVLSVCDTLKAVHREGIIHRDLSPDNIYRTINSEIKLIDFGAARYETSRNSKSLSVILKSGYAPEEQYRSHGDQGPWTDVYALAATFYKMLTNETPQDSMERAVYDELKLPSALGAVLPQPGENAIMNGLIVRSADRVQSIEEWEALLVSDQVKRKKVKKQKSDAGSIPLWGKLLGIGAAVFLVLGLLTATGVMGGELNWLTDNFGSGLSEGHLNTPGVINSTQEEARETVEAEGLQLLITGKEYSEKIEKGKVLAQSPKPGRSIALGEAVEVTICGGVVEELSENDIPDVTLLPFEEAEVKLWAIRGVEVEKQFRYAPGTQRGLVLKQEESRLESGIIHILLTISLGAEETAADAPTLPFLAVEASEDQLYLRYILPKSTNGKMESYFEYEEENGNWIWLKGNEEETGDTENRGGEFETVLEHDSFMAQLNHIVKKSQTRLKLRGSVVSWSAGKQSEPYLLPYEIVIHRDPKKFPKVEIEGVGEAEPDQKEVLSLQKQYGLDSIEGYYSYRVIGGFRKGESYYIYEGTARMGKDRKLTCEKDGELLLLCEEEFDASSVLAGFFRLHGARREENGSYLLEIGQATTIDGSTLLLDSAVDPAEGRTVLDLVEEIGGKAGAYQYRLPYRFKLTESELPRGAVADFYMEGDQQNGEVYKLNILVSMRDAGGNTPLPVPVQWIPDDSFKSWTGQDAPYPMLRFFTLPGDDRSADASSELRTRMELSNDGGNTFHQPEDPEDLDQYAGYLFDGRSGSDGYSSPEANCAVSYLVYQFEQAGLMRLGDEIMLRLTTVDENGTAQGESVIVKVPLL